MSDPPPDPPVEPEPPIDPTPPPPVVVNVQSPPPPAAPQPLLFASGTEPTIHGLVGTYFGDLEIDQGKSVRWLAHFTDDLFITDINTGEQRYWVVDWAHTFPNSEHIVTGRNFFLDAANWRREQFEYGDKAFRYSDDDWCLFIDGSDGLSFDHRSRPDDYNAAPFKSWIYREVERAASRGQSVVYLPFFVYLHHSDLQTITYGLNVTQDAVESGIPAAQKTMAVPWYLPYQWLPRLFKVSTLRSPSFDWTLLDRPVADPPVGTSSYLTPTVGSVTTPDPGPLPSECCFVMKLRGPFEVPGQSVAPQVVGQWESDTQASWVLHQYISGTFLIEASTTGNWADAVSDQVQTPPVSGDDQHLALSWDLDNGAGRWGLTTWESPDGSTWTQHTSHATPYNLPSVLWDSASVMRVGGVVGYWAFGGRIYSIELRTGLDPTGVAPVGTQMVFPAVGVNHFSVPGTTFEVLSGDITMIWNLASADWTKTYQSIIARRGGNVNSFDVLLGHYGGNQPSMTLYAYGDGTIANRRIIGSDPFPAAVNNQSTWMALTYDVDNGAGGTTTRFWRSTDGLTWTKVGTDKVNAGTFPLKVDTGTPVNIGAIDSGDSTFKFIGRMKRVIVRNGIGAAGVPGGTTVLDLSENNIPNDTVTSFTATSGQTVTMFGDPLGPTIPSEVLWKFNADDYPGTGTSYTDPRGRTWTLTSPTAITRIEPPKNAKAQIVNYSYAHWHPLDIPPGQTEVEPLSAANDHGYKMRKLISRLRPIPGLPFNEPWNPPSADTEGLPGPWGIDVIASVSPSLATTIEEDGHTATDAATAGILTPIYTNVVRQSLRDGLWYEQGTFGNIPLIWDDVNQKWIPRYNPEQWPESGLRSGHEPPPPPSPTALRLGGAAGDYVSTQNLTYEFRFSLSLVACIALDNWTDGEQSIVAQDQAWSWTLDADGGMTFSRSRDGSTFEDFTIPPEEVPPWADKEVVILGVSYATVVTPDILVKPVDEARFWLWSGAEWGEEWEQLGTTQSVLNDDDDPIFNSSAPIKIGGGTPGLFRVVSIRPNVDDNNGIGTGELARMRGDVLSNPSYDRYGNTWTNHGTWSFEEMDGMPTVLPPPA